MRSLLALGLLVALCVSANAATVHRPRTRQSTAVRSSTEIAPPTRFAVPGWSDEATRRWLYNASSSVGRGG